MATIKLSDGSVFQGWDEEELAKAVAAYASKGATNSDTAKGIFDFGKITLSPEVTKIVEKVPVEVEKIVERTVQVPVLPERPLTKDEMAFITNLTKNAARQKNVEALIALGIVGAIGVAFTYSMIKASK